MKSIEAQYNLTNDELKELLGSDMETKVNHEDNALLLALSIEARECVRDGKPLPWHLHKDLVAAIVNTQRSYGVKAMEVIVETVAKQCDEIVGKK